MVLYRENRQGFVAQSLAGLIVQIDMRHLDLAGRKAGGIHGKAVVLCRDLNLLRGQIFHRMIAAAVAELQFKGFPTQSQAQELMTETDAHDSKALRRLSLAPGPDEFL